MNEQNIMTTVNKNEQSINAIYELLGQTFPDKNIQREPLITEQVGNLAFVNPGTKSIYNAFQKLDRKIRSKSDAENNIEMKDIIQRDYAGRNADLLDNLSDWSRFAIIIPNYTSAPEIVENFLHQFGGQVDFHERPDYEAIHLHTNYKDVNLEFQFHTKEYAELKKATDVFYHQYNNIVVMKNSKIEDQKKTLEDAIIQHCQTVYQGSDFKASLPKVEAVYEKYKAQNATVPTPKLKHFCEYVKKADMVQKELSEFLPTFLQPMNKLASVQNSQVIENSNQITDLVANENNI